MHRITFLKGNFKSFPFFIVFLILFISCSGTTNENTVDLIYDTQYLLQKDEKLIENRGFFIDEFKKLRDSINATDIALHKIIEHPNYTTYIAIDVYDTGGKELTQKNFIVMDRNVTVYKHRTTTQKNFYAIFVSQIVNDSLDFNASIINNRFEKK